jgi:hypothetical protein
LSNAAITGSTFAAGAGFGAFTGRILAPSAAARAREEAARGRDVVGSTRGAWGRSEDEACPPPWGAG